MMKRALGRGLGALLPPAEPEDGGRLRELPVESLVPNPQQPRRTFDSRALEELAVSIRASGILQPLVVRPRGQPVRDPRRASGAGGPPSRRG